MIDVPLRFLTPVHVAVDAGVALDGRDFFVDHSRADATFGTTMPATLLVDSKSCTSVVARPLLGDCRGAESHGMRGAGWRIAAAELASGVVAIEGVPAVRGPLFSLDLDFVNRHLAAPVDGIIGADLFREFVIELDYERSRLRLHRPAVPASGLWNAPTVYFESGRPLPVIHAAVGGRDVRLILDTASSAALLLFDRRLGSALAPLATEHFAEVGLGVPGRVGVGRTQLSFGAWRWSDLRFQFVLEPPSVFAQLAAGGIDGIVSPGVLLGSRARLVVGRSRWAVHGVPPGERLALENLSGLRVARRSGCCEIVGVEWQSPAARRGIAVGDQIVELDGRPISGKDLVAVGRALAQSEGARLTLTLRRRSQRRRIVEMVLARFD